MAGQTTLLIDSPLFFGLRYCFCHLRRNKTVFDLLALFPFSTLSDDLGAHQSVVTWLKNEAAGLW